MDKKKKEKMRSASIFSVEERDAIIKEYLRGRETKRNIWQRHTGQKYEKGQRVRWMRQLG